MVTGAPSGRAGRTDQFLAFVRPADGDSEGVSGCAEMALSSVALWMEEQNGEWPATKGAEHGNSHQQELNGKIRRWAETVGDYSSSRTRLKAALARSATGWTGERTRL